MLDEALASDERENFGRKTMRVPNMTEHVRAQYARHENYDPYFEGDLFLTPDGQISAAEFDRWLESVKVKERQSIIALFDNKHSEFTYQHQENKGAYIDDCWACLALSLIKGKSV